MHRWREAKRFKDYIVGMFRYYTIIVVCIIFILFGISLFFNFKTTIVKTNISYNKALGNFIEDELDDMRKNIDRLSREESIVDALTGKNEVWEANILLYDYINGQRLKSNFALLDTDNNVKATNLYKKNQDILSNSRDITEITQRIDKSREYIYMDLNSIDFKYGQNSSLFLSKSIKQDDEIIGYIIFFLRDEGLRLHTRSKDVDIVTITDRYENVIFTTNNLIINSMGKINIKDSKRNTTIFNGQPYYIEINRIQDKAINIFTMTSIDEYRQFLILGIIFSLIISFLMVILVGILSPKIIERNLNSLDSLVYGVGQLRDGNIDYRIESKTFEEFQTIYDEFNNMASRIQNLIRDNSEIAERKRIMEIRHLESQFNPHFVYNVMEMLRYEILFDPKLASEMLVSFAKLMRYNTNYGSIEVPFRMDMEYIESYLKIQKMRFGERLNYNIDMESSFKDHKIPKLILQPIVENSIKHGIENTRSLNIDIRVRKIKKDMEITVEDNGQGIEMEKLMYLKKLLKDEVPVSEHIGIYNVQRVLKLLYGEDYGLKIDSEIDLGTRVILKIPLIEDDTDV